MEKIRWGIISTGKIAHALARTFQEVDDAELVAVASRSQASADEFGAQYNVPNCYASYEAMMEDKDVDAVYIATPHSHHYENMLMCIEAGKHILCEKAFTLNAQQAQICIDRAREKGVFLMEAMWTRFIPATVQARQWIAEGLIGEIKQVRAEFCVHLPYNPEGRIYNPQLGGGALLDLGIYPISFATHWLGIPDDVYSFAFLGETGVDEYESIMFGYENGAIAQLSAGVRFNGTREATIVGDKGYIRFHPNFHHSERLTIKQEDTPERVVDIPHTNGYRYEVEEVHRCIKAGKTESDIMPLDETLAIMTLMDTLREEWGVEYPNE